MPDPTLLKTLAFIHRNDSHFAVGDFSPVLSVFSYHELGATLSPFLLLDHIGPGYLRAGSRQRGVHDHPHRGFETVTLVYAGELEHRDSNGGGGLIGPGDVQWMTAGAGLVHRELFSPAFSQQGGRFEMIQLWVNLPAAKKMSAPRYQHLHQADMPWRALPEAAGQWRLVAGEQAGHQGPALTHSPLQVIEAKLAAGKQARFSTRDGDTALIYLRRGQLQLDAENLLEAQALAVFSAQGSNLAVHATEASEFLLLTGTPLHEPINGHGPFVMNSYEEILAAYDDIKHGRFGQDTTSATD